MTSSQLVVAWAARPSPRPWPNVVRGEAMHPWGVAEARALGIYKLLYEACGHEIPWRDTYPGPERLIHRDLSTTTPQRTAEFAFYHPTMQEVLLTAAAEAGTEIRRGARGEAGPRTDRCD
jgi:hypothetical protein